MFDTTSLTPDVLIIGAVMCLMILLGAWKAGTDFWRWLIMPSQSPEGLFYRLIKTHHLTAREKRILHSVRKRLPPTLPPATLFVDPRVWTALTQYGEGQYGEGQHSVDRHSIEPSNGIPCDETLHSTDSMLGKPESLGPKHASTAKTVMKPLVAHTPQESALFEKIFGFDPNRYQY